MHDCPPPEHEPSRVLHPVDIVPILRVSLSTLAKEIRDFNQGKRFDGDARHAESRNMEAFHLERAVDAARSLLRGWNGSDLAGFGVFPRCWRGYERARILLLTSEPFGGGTSNFTTGDDEHQVTEVIEELPVIALATDDNLRELTEILEELCSWPGMAAESRDTAPPASEPSGTVPAAAIDYKAIASDLRKASKPTQAALVEFMADREEATVEDVAKHVHKDDEASEGTIRANARRTNDWLASRGVPLSFRVAGGRVFREISPV
jgi:hypothetical protein